MCCQHSQLGSGAAPAAGAHLPPIRQLPKFPPPLLSLGCATLGMPRMGLSWGHQFKCGCADSAGTVGSGMAHLVWGQRLWEWL